MTDASVRLAEADGARFHRGSESDRWTAEDRDGMAIVSDAMSIAEAARLYCEDRGLPSCQEILDRIAATYRPYHVRDEFWDGFTAYHHGDLKNPYMGADSRDHGCSVKAQAWDRGANVAMQYQRALAHRATTPDETDEAEPGWLVKLLRTGRR
jgi:hypothetical protein